MNVFKNKKRWQNKKNVKNVPWIKNVKNGFYIYALYVYALGSPSH